MAATYQIKKKAIGGYSVTYDCPHCSAALTSRLDEAGTSQPCPTCSKPFVVPGKNEFDKLRAMQAQERRDKAQAEEKRDKERALQEQLAADDAARQAALQKDLEAQQRQYAATHCPFCGETITPGVKKCKHCHEYLDPELRERAAVQHVAGVKMSLDDMFWLVVKFWGASVLFFFVFWVCVILFFGLVGLSFRSLAP